MGLSYIENIVSEMVKKHDTVDPFRICAETGIIIEYEDFDQLKGMYICICNKRFIILNSNLDEQTMKVVCAHELGHDILHRDFATEKGIRDVMIYDMTSKPEREANEFAAALLISDEEIFDLMNYGYTWEQTASELGYDPGFIGIKLNLLKKRGVDINIPNVKADFLKQYGKGF